MEIILSHLGVGMAYIAFMGWILFMQKKGLWQQLIHAAAGCEKFFFTLGGLVLMMNLHIFPFMLTIYDYFLNRLFCILCHAKGRIIYKKFFRM